MESKLLREYVQHVLSEKSLVFQHHSPDFYATLKPVTYSELALTRTNPVYMTHRSQTESEYHELLSEYDRKKSFLYATVVGFNQMEPADAYPGFTYFFKLTPQQISDTVFEVVDGQFPSPPGRGQVALLAAISHWNKFERLFASYDDPIAGGVIDPRIEVVIPFEVEYFDFVPQIEDR